VLLKAWECSGNESAGGWEKRVEGPFRCVINPVKWLSHLVKRLFAVYPRTNPRKRWERLAELPYRLSSGLGSQSLD